MIQDLNIYFRIWNNLDYIFKLYNLKIILMNNLDFQHSIKIHEKLWSRLRNSPIIMCIAPTKFEQFSLDRHGREDGTDLLLNKVTQLLLLLAIF